MASAQYTPEYLHAYQGALAAAVDGHASKLYFYATKHGMNSYNRNSAMIKHARELDGLLLSLPIKHAPVHLLHGISSHNIDSSSARAAMARQASDYLTARRAELARCTSIPATGASAPVTPS